MDPFLFWFAVTVLIATILAAAISAVIWISMICENMIQRARDKHFGGV